MQPQSVTILNLDNMCFTFLFSKLLIHFLVQKMYLTRFENNISKILLR